MSRLSDSSRFARSRGFSLIQCLAFLCIVMILGTTLLRVVYHGMSQTLESHWGRQAEALADGALEMALVHLRDGGGEGRLDAKLDCGFVVIEVQEGQNENTFVILFQGASATEERIRASRIYEAQVAKMGGDAWKVLSVRRI